MSSNTFVGLGCSDSKLFKLTSPVIYEDSNYRLVMFISYRNNTNTLAWQIFEVTNAKFKKKVLKTVIHT